ncbi:MAG: PfkB family carbohydrate kinase [Treponema sp.]|jgi:sugar/nucleoside kinase (ribokinase family)|nr:PfkB family carbohydrate kinase [Treponema sp.]
MTKNELFCIGNPLVDLFATVNSSYPRQHGIVQQVQHIDHEQAQRIFNELRFDKKAASQLASGGGAANVAKIAAMLGMNAAFAGSTGNDEMAAVFANELRKVGVSLFLKKGEGKTGICCMLNSGGESVIAAAPGAALEYMESDIQDEWITGAEAVVLDGYILDRRPLVQRILELAATNGIPIALDVASAFHIREKTEEILHYSRNYPLIVFMNADESIAFYNTIKKTAIEEEVQGEREKEALILRDICPVLKYITEGEIFPIIVIKLGGRGAVVLAGGNIYRAETFTVTPRNTVGAGDAFCAAFICAWIRGKSISECAALGNRVAREILLVPGTKIKAGKLRAFAKLLKKR